MNSATLSGKRLTIGLLIVLLATGGLFYWVTTAYSAYNASRRETDRQWRELAALLEVRYAALDKRVADGIAQQVIPASMGDNGAGPAIVSKPPPSVPCRLIRPTKSKRSLPSYPYQPRTRTVQS